MTTVTADVTNTITARATTPRGRSLFSADRVAIVARPVVMVALAALVSALPAERPAAWLWIAALLIAGMPHGSYDLAAMRGSRWAHTARAFAAIATLYTLGMLLCGVVFLLAPAVGTVGFLVLSAHHFGLSDSIHTRLTRSLAFPNHLFAAARGSVVIAAPFAFQPAESWAVFADIAAAMGSHAPRPANLGMIAGSLTLAAVVIVSVGLVSAWRRHRRGLALEEAAIVVAAAALAFVVDPLLAIGVYFVVVHAAGHCLRADRVDTPAVPPSAKNIWRVHRGSLPLNVVSVALVVALAVATTGLTAYGVALAFIAFCIAATLPHHLLWFCSPSRLPRGGVFIPPLRRPLSLRR